MSNDKIQKLEAKLEALENELDRVRKAIASAEETMDLLKKYESELIARCSTLGMKINRQQREANQDS